MGFIIVSISMGWLLNSLAAEPLPFRLEGNVMPQHYDLLITAGLDVTDFQFEGEVRIEILCSEDTSRIVIHSKDLNIDEARVSVEGATEETKGIKILEHTYDEANEFYIVQLDSDLIEGSTYIFFIPFSGTMSKNNFGFYRSSHDEKVWMGITQFSPADARRAFPCFDEPQMKATFQITIEHPEKYIALSNMPPRSKKPKADKPDWTVVQFEKSFFRMPTYTVGFIISDLANSGPVRSKSGVEFTVWATRDQLDVTETKFVKEQGPKMLNCLEIYLSSKFPLSKIDLVVVPSLPEDPLRATENWGLIVFPSKYLQKDTSSKDLLELVAYQIAFELAHHWFGNSVTVEWWNELWLHKGLSQYFAVIAMDAVNPDWKMLNAAWSISLKYAFTTDAPIVRAVESPEAILNMFNDPTMTVKGSLMVRMMRHFLGDTVFRAGIRQYLEKHKFGNVNQDDLWEAMMTVAEKQDVLPHGITVKMVMEPWLFQEGSPVLEVHYNATVGAFSVMQHPFTISAGDNNSLSTLWPIPLTYTTSANPDFNKTKAQLWLMDRGPLFIPDPKEDKTLTDPWIIFNLQYTVVCRVTYFKENAIAFAEALLFEDQIKLIHALNRVYFFVDALTLGQLPGRRG